MNRYGDRPPGRQLAGKLNETGQLTQAAYLHEHRPFGDGVGVAV